MNDLDYEWMIAQEMSINSNELCEGLIIISYFYFRTVINNIDTRFKFILLDDE